MMVGNLNKTKVIIVNLNMGAKVNDFTKVKDYNPRKLSDTIPHAQAYWNVWDETTDNEYIKQACYSPQEMIKIIESATTFDNEELQRVYKEVLDFFIGDNREKNIEITNDKKKQQQHAQIEHYYWYVILPLIQLKFPFEKNFVPLALLVDDYYSGIAGHGNSALRIKYENKKGKIDFTNWHEYYSEMYERIVEGKDTSEKQLVFEENAFLKNKLSIQHFEEIMLVQLFPYSSIDGTALSGDVLQSIWDDSIRFLKKFIKTIDDHNLKNPEDKIVVVMNRKGGRWDEFENTIDSLETNFIYKNVQPSYPKHLNQNIHKAK